MTDTTDTSGTLVMLTAGIVAAHVTHNAVPISDLATLIQNVHAALSGLGRPAEPETPRPEPAVSIKASVKPDYLVCLEDGKKVTLLKRHLMTKYQMTPDQYRARWGLPRDYPMIAPNYAERRRALAKSFGLGRAHRSPSPGSNVPVTASGVPEPAPGPAEASASE